MLAEAGTQESLASPLSKLHFCMARTAQKYNLKLNWYHPWHTLYKPDHYVLRVGDKSRIEICRDSFSARVIWRALCWTWLSAQTLLPHVLGQGRAVCWICICGDLWTPWNGLPLNPPTGALVNLASQCQSRQVTQRLWAGRLACPNFRLTLCHKSLGISRLPQTL